MRRESAFPIVLLIILLVSLSSAIEVQSVKASGTIYIRADGSIDPPTAPISTIDNVTYTLTCNITADTDGIVIERDNIVVDGADYSVTGSGNGTGTTITDRSNVTLRNTTIKNFDSGIVLSYSSSSTLSGNNVANNWNGIWLYSSSNSTLSGNNVTANKGYGIRIYSSANNVFYHNNLINNTQHVYVVTSGNANSWDDGYPSGGNYWSDYNGTDANHDGIGDPPYVIDANNTDHYPLMGMFNSFNVTYYTQPIVPHACNVTVISNSTISDFVAPIWIEHPEVIFLQFNVSGAEGSNGFCRVSFPTAMMNGTYHVSLNGTEIPYTLLPCSDVNTSYLYFNYTHSTKKVIIIPEFPSFLVLPLFTVTILLAVIVYRRKRLYPRVR
jgi:parallel beta-helix repeat protein